MTDTRTPTSFGRRVAKERAQRGWTLRRLADLTGLAHARIHRIETDPDRDVTFEDAVRLADAFGMPISWLVHGSQIRDRVLAAARTETADSVDEAIDEVLPVLELAAQLDDLDDTLVHSPSVSEHPRRDQNPRDWGRTVAERVRRDWDVLDGPLRDLAHLI